MNARSSVLLPPWPLLLLLLLLTPALPVPGGPFSPALVLSCPANFTVSGAEEHARLHNTEEKGNDTYKYLYTYVHPEEDFKGVSLVAVMGETNYTAWFPLNNTCFPDDKVWWWRTMAAVKKMAQNSDYSLTIQLRSGECIALCTKTVRSRAALSLQVVAHGPSSWIHHKPDQQNCSTKNESTEPFPKTLKCTEPPPPKTTTPHQRPHSTTPRSVQVPGTATNPTTTTTPITFTTPTTATTLITSTTPTTATAHTDETEYTAPSTAPKYTEEVVIVVVVVAVVMVVIVVVVLVVERNRHRRETTQEDVVMQRSQGASSTGEMVVVENNLYEAWETIQPPSHGTSDGEEEKRRK